jgi:lipid-A-disaccharide synthase
MPQSRVRIGIVAGEASGDLIGSHLVLGLKRHLPEAEFVGIAGPLMQAAGVESLFPMETLSVRGVAEVLGNLRDILAIRRELARRFLADPPDLFVGVDAPDFNLALEAKLKASGIPTVQYVGPAIWAWGRGRIEKVRRAVKRVLSIFPFEQSIYEAAGIPVTYVGHPLADMLPENPDRATARVQMRLPQDVPVIALLPGSRKAELHYMADLFVNTGRLLADRIPDLRFLVPLVTRETREMFEAAIFRNDARELPITMLFGHAHEAMTAADAVVACSGTATLEAALLNRPMVITYKMAPLTWWVAQRRAYTQWAGLPNILANELLVPEFIQDQATPENLAQGLIDLVSDEERICRIEERFAQLHQLLRRDTAKTAALAVLPYLVKAAT